MIGLFRFELFIPSSATELRFNACRNWQHSEKAETGKPNEFKNQHSQFKNVSVAQSRPLTPCAIQSHR
jgi:hypothetical protein